MTGAPGRSPATPAERTGLRVLSYALGAQLPAGTPLVAKAIGNELGLSRFPVQRGLAWLRDQGLASQPTGRGFVLAAGPAAIRRVLARAGEASLSTYQIIAQDRLRGVLPKAMTETGLAQRYGLTRAQLSPILKRMAQEGWIRRRPGHGWEFADIIDSPQSLADAYAFRIAIEPAALLAPGFALEQAALERLRAEQAALRDGQLGGRVTSEELFEIGARFHETVVGFSRNPFFVDAIRQVNRLRRLLEYKAMARPADFGEQCLEHLALLDMLERGERRQAAEFLQRHLSIVGKVKQHRLGQQHEPGPMPAAHF
ncbi:GntR family transcriptional regulator [Pigmentiphaga soli]|uniref:GntR family transcriptional regulator n=1 Tax=Pigmentiphaga soli TaxID=1007095 RepID=A0ABP8HJH0_9BURK